MAMLALSAVDRDASSWLERVGVWDGDVTVCG